MMSHSQSKMREVETAEKPIKSTANPNHTKSPAKQSQISGLAKEETVDIVKDSRSEVSYMSPRSLLSSSSKPNTIASFDSRSDKLEASNKSRKVLSLSDLFGMTLEELKTHAQSRGITLPDYKPDSILPGHPELEFEDFQAVN